MTPTLKLYKKMQKEIGLDEKTMPKTLFDKNKKKEIEKLLTDEKKLRTVAQITNPYHAISKIVFMALMKMTHKLHQKPPNNTLLNQIKTYWIPIANNFGMWKIRYYLEDIVFAHTDYKKYSLIRSLLRAENHSSQKIFNEINNILSYYFKKAKLKKYEIIYRKKNTFGVYEKMHRKNKNINHVTDVLGIRIIVMDKKQCYAVLEILKNLWPLYEERFKDYIENPKQNGYQSLHVELSCIEGQTVEFQIRTKKMDDIAKYGLASHALYKKKSS